jgi:hypothetical protein
MHISLNARLAWTVAAGVGCAGLLSSAALAGAAGGPSLPTQANSHAVAALAARPTPSGSSDSSDPAQTDSADPADTDTSEPAQTDSSTAEDSADSSAPTATPVGPDATGPAAFGLCTAYEHAKVHGSAVKHSIAFRNLAAAAGGADQIDAYCATVVKPGGPSSTEAPAAAGPEDSSSDEPSEPSEPSDNSSDASGEPSHSHPAGAPTSVPSHSHPSH